MKYFIILFSFATLFVSYLNITQLEAGQPRIIRNGWYAPVRRPDISRFPGMGSPYASPYSVVTHSGLYKTGRHGGYYGARNAILPNR